MIFVGNSCTIVPRWWKALIKGGEEVAGREKCFYGPGIWSVSDASSNHRAVQRYCCVRMQYFKATPVRDQQPNALVAYNTPRGAGAGLIAIRALLQNSNLC